MSVEHAWQGRVDEASFRVRARISGSEARLIYATNEALTDPSSVGPDAATSDNMVTLDATGLDADTRYYWAIEVDGTVDPDVTGTCRTAPTAGEPASFVFAVSGDAGLNPDYPGVGTVDAADRLSNSPVFDTIRRHDPAWFAHLGDMTYYDLGSGNHGLSATASLAQYRSMYNDVLTQPYQHRLYREVPLVYIYDDHDYGPNNGDSTSPGRDNAVTAYRERVPSYEPGLTGSLDPVGQTWTWGRIRFLMWDSRADRDPAASPPTQLGAAQKAWIDSVLSSATEEFLIVFSPSPWIGLADDTWAGYEEERQEIAAMIAGHGWADRMVMISADKHVLAIDSGAGNTAGGWPCAVLAPVDANPGVLTDQYDLGMTAARGQYGLVEVADRGHVIEVTITGWTESDRWRSHTVRAQTSTPFSTTFPREQAPWRVEIAPGADPGDPGTWVWEDVTGFVRVGDAVEIDYGRSDEFAEVSPTACGLVLDNRDGRFSPRNPLSPYYGEIGLNTPLRVSWGGIYPRFTGYVSSWSPRWNQTGSDATVPVRADGILRRLSQGRKPLYSAIRREITAPSRPKAIAYWPMEDGSDANHFASAFPTGRILQVSNGEPEPGAYEGFPGSDPVALLGTGRMFGPVPTAQDTGDLIVRAVVHAPENGVAENGSILVVNTTGTASRWAVVLDGNGELQLLAENDSGTTLLDTTFRAFEMNGRHVSLAVDLHTNGPDIEWTLLAFDMDDRTALQLQDTLAGHSVGYATSVELNYHERLEDVAVGHVTVTNDRDLFGNTADVLSGYRGERAADRISRLCGEEGIAITVRGDAADTMPMGEQRSETLLDLLREAERTDGGVLYELDGTLAYQTRTDRYNRAAVMDMDVADRHLAEPPEPTDDDQAVRNQVDASRDVGSSATVRDAEHIARYGRYDASVSVNTETDQVLQDIAGWHVHLGTVDDMRWPSVQLDLASTPDLIPAWLDTRLGDRIRVTYSPPQLPSTDIDVHVEGWRERLNIYSWDIELNCSPSAPWRIGQAGGTDAGRLDTDGSALDGAVMAADSELVVGTTDPNAPLWVTGTLGTASTATPAGTSTAATQSDTALTVPLPDGWQPGQLAIAVFNANDDLASYVTHPGGDGWSTIDGSPRTSSSMTLGAWYKILETGDSDPSITLDQAQKISGVVATYDGVTLDGADPIAVEGARAERGGTSSTETIVPGITTTQEEQRLILILAEKSSSSTTVSASTGYEARTVQFTEGGGQASVALFDRTYATEGTDTADVTATYDESSGAGYGILLALNNAVDDRFDVDLAGETCTVHQIEDAMTDDFDRTVVDGWGTSTSGHVWSVTGGNGATDFSVDAGSGKVSLDTIEDRRFTWTGGRDWRDVDIYADITVPATATGGPISAGIVARWSDISNFYMCNLFHRPEGDIYLAIFKCTDFDFLTVADKILPLTYAGGIPTHARFQAVGDRLRAKVWADGDDEPGLWHVDATDPTHNVGAIGTHSNLNSGNTNTQPVTIEYTNWHLVNPQRFTVTRSVNGIEKDQNTGAAVKLTTPMVLGL